MGTTSQKLTYLNDTKIKIRNRINSLGGSLDSDDTFRSYADELESLYNEMPKVSESDVESASLSPTREGAMAITYKGDTQQDSTPTPSSPQPIHNVSGDNTIEICGKNLLDTSNARTDKTWLTRNSDGTLTLNYPSGNNVNFTNLFTNNINIPTGNYRIKLFVEGTYVGGNLLILNSNGATIIQGSIIDGREFTITNSDIGNFQFYVLKAGTNCTIGIEIEKGTIEPTSYTSYVSQTQLISLGVENLCSQVSIQDSATIRCNVDNKKLEQTFTISLTPPKTVSQMDIVAFADSTNLRSVGKIDLTLDTKSSATITLTQSIYETIQSASEVHFNIYKSGAGISTTATINDAQIENGSKLNSYTPYGTTPIELNKIGNYQDYIYKTDKWYWHKEIGKVVLDGSEDYGLANNVFYTSNSTILQQVGVKIVKSNYFQEAYNQPSTSNVNTYNPDNSICGSTSGTNRFYIKCTSITSTTDFKTWLQSHNTIVYYVLSTPTDIEITDSTLVEQLETIKRSYDGVTNISQENNDLPFILDVSALKEWE